MNIEESIKLVYKAIDDKQGEDIKILKIGNISSLADYFIITSASNERQVKSITDNIEKELEGILPYIAIHNHLAHANPQDKFL